MTILGYLSIAIILGILYIGYRIITANNGHYRYYKIFGHWRFQVKKHGCWIDDSRTFDSEDEVKEAIQAEMKIDQVAKEQSMTAINFVYFRNDQK